MIIHDDNDVRDLFAAALQVRGFKTAQIEDARLAIEEIKNNPDEFSLVLVDRSSQEDLEFPKQVKTINDQIKIGLTSAFAFNDAEISTTAYDRILQLPITMSELVSAVREILD